MLKSVHRWLGLALCLVIFVISITGSLLLLKREYLWLTIDESRGALDQSKPVVALALDKIQSQYEEDELRFVQLFSEDLNLHKAYLSERRYAWHNAKGEQLQVWSSNDRFEDWLLDLHHRFLLGNTIGLNIAGFGGILLLPLSIIGLIVWWPRRRTLRLGFRPNSTKRGAWMRSHGNIGAVTFIPLVLLAFTGVILVYPSEARFVLVGGFDEPLPVTTSAKSWEGSSDWLHLFEVAERTFPQSKLRWVGPARPEHPAISIGVQQSQGWNRMGQSSLNFEKGQVRINNALEQSKLKRTVDFSYPLHTGKINGLYRWLFCLFGIGMAALAVFGLISFFKRN